jgi:hypothetical protein
MLLWNPQRLFTLLKKQQYIIFCKLIFVWVGRVGGGAGDRHRLKGIVMYNSRKEKS